MQRKKSKAHFISILPASLLLSCTPPSNGGRTNTPPDYGPPPSYGPRVSHPDGTCSVHISGNPPQNFPVSCSAPIERIPDHEGCQVESANDPAIKVGVQCEEEPLIRNPPSPG